jgi:transposase
MIQITPHMRVLIAIEPADFRRGIDGLARVCREALSEDPFSGAMFVFRNRRQKGIKILVYDGQGFWLCYKRLSAGRFSYWPQSAIDKVTRMQAHQLQVLLNAGDPNTTRAAPQWRPIGG